MSRSSPLAIAEALWPHTPIVNAYAVIEEALREEAADSSSPGVVRQLKLADALERAMRDDPLLPPELRRDPWAPTEIRAAWAHRWDALQEADGSVLYQGWWPPMSASVIR